MPRATPSYGPDELGPDPFEQPTADEEDGDAPECATERAAGLPDAEALPDLSVLQSEPVRGIPSSGFGWRDDPIRHRRRFHRGSDFRAPRGTPVYAAAGGHVAFAGRRRGYGKMIDIRHADGLLTRYAHLAAIDVAGGAAVRADTCIGRVGSTGRATGPHLHFEVRLDGRAVDPALAAQVGELQRVGAAPGALRAAAERLSPAVQDATVSTLDPPRPGRSAARRSRHRPNS